MESKQLIKTLTAVLDQYQDQVLFAYLFGSHATGDLSLKSDVDIAVYLSHFEAPFKARMMEGDLLNVKLSLYDDLCRALKRNDVDIILLNTMQNIILLGSIIQHGVVLCDRDRNHREDYELKIMHRYIDFKEQRFAVMGV